MEEINDDIVFLNAQPVEVFTNGIGELTCVLPSKLFAPSDSGRVDTNTSRLCENPLMIFALKRSRGVESVGSSIRMQNVAVESRPLKLFKSTVNESHSNDEASELTPGFTVSCPLPGGTAVVGFGATAAPAPLFVTSRRFDPVELATRRILPLAWCAFEFPFFSFALGVSSFGSSWPLPFREDLFGAM